MVERLVPPKGEKVGGSIPSIPAVVITVRTKGVLPMMTVANGLQIWSETPMWLCPCCGVVVGLDAVMIGNGGQTMGCPNCPEGSLCELPPLNEAA